jgi:RNA polymerase sigma-70 factor (ECF subfamily)
MSADPAVRDAMLAAVPGLRAYAISLCRNIDRADDLVQETLLPSKRAPTCRPGC